MYHLMGWWQRDEAKAQLENQDSVGTDDPKKLAKIIEGKQAKAV